MITTYPVTDISLIVKCRVPITPLVTEFYLLERLHAECKPSFSHAQNAISNEIHMKYQKFTSVFARTLRDYLVLICAGEARHGWKCGCGSIKEIPSADTRHVIYARSIEHDPIATLSATAKLFSRYGWDGSVGGMQWYSIADWGLKYGQVPDRIFCDTVMTLQHNNSNVFGKPVMFILDSRLITTLNTKLFCDLLEWPMHKWSSGLLKNLKVGLETLDLLRRAARVGIIQTCQEQWANLDVGKYRYILPHVVWGTRQDYTFVTGRWEGLCIPDMFKEANVPMPVPRMRMGDCKQTYWTHCDNDLVKPTNTDTNELPKPKPKTIQGIAMPAWMKQPVKQTTVADTTI